ncbi:hypothetical protein QR680_007561 [Steinernema hermaphroditum]|uniref:Peptidase M1 membrane alanine aminopeptidase domain-containing protein n=1 Tax=Steinernema hermaphroditum TaxID=289476 RepID=A0AA39M6L4_9BILA|nr:hypothetical protein QR680_007561 [Steinernema hermaphroditum]
MSTTADKFQPEDKWWTDLRLKEGFASFMEYMFVGSNNPEFKIWLHFVNDELAAGLSLDALRKRQTPGANMQFYSTSKIEHQ